MMVLPPLQCIRSRRIPDDSRLIAENSSVRMYGMSAAPIELILSSMLPGKTYDSIIKLMIHKFNTFLQEL